MFHFILTLLIWWGICVARSVPRAGPTWSTSSCWLSYSGVEGRERCWRHSVCKEQQRKDETTSFNNSLLSVLLSDVWQALQLNVCVRRTLGSYWHQRPVPCRLLHSVFTFLVCGYVFLSALIVACRVWPWRHEEMKTIGIGHPIQFEEKSRTVATQKSL